MKKEEAEILEEMRNAKKKVEFGEEGVVFYFPAKLKDLIVCDLGKPTDWPCEPSQIFKRNGFVINFDIRSCSAENHRLVNEFKLPEPFILEVKISDASLIEAGINVGELKLGICYGTVWQDKSQVATELQVNDPDWDRSWAVFIQKWDDPVVAWGP